jgi:CheY-like chemotaxis protein
MSESRATVLVVDDESAVVTMLSLYLGSLGYAVRAARSGSEAVELYRRVAAEVALVLIDTNMAGMDGPSTYAALRAIDPGVRCCLMSGGHAPWIEGAAFLEKPFDLAKLKELLASVPSARG